MRTQKNAEGPFPKTKEVPTAGQVQAVFDGAGVSFVPVSGTVGKGSRGSTSEASRLNSTIGPHLNRVIRAVAHLSGTQDYKRIWEELFKNQFFPPVEKETQDEKGTSGG